MQIKTVQAFHELFFSSIKRKAEWLIVRMVNVNGLFSSFEKG